MTVADREILCAIRANAKPTTRTRIAEILAIDDDSELAGQVSRLVREDLLHRSEFAAHKSITYTYSLAPNGKALLDSAPLECARLVEGLKARITAETIRERAGMGSRARTNPPAPASVASPSASMPVRTAPASRLAGEEGSKSASREGATEARADAAHTKEKTMPKKTQQDTSDIVIRFIVKESQWLSAAQIIKGTRRPTSEVRPALRALAKDGSIQARGATASRRYGKVGLTWREDPPKAPAAKTSKKVKRAPARGGRSRPTAQPPQFASFNAQGEIVLTSPGGLKFLSVDETRQVITLVRAFDKAGLLPA